MSDKDLCFLWCREWGQIIRFLDLYQIWSDHHSSWLDLRITYRRILAPKNVRIIVLGPRDMRSRLILLHVNLLCICFMWGLTEWATIQSYEYDCPEVNYNYGFGLYRIIYPYYNTQLYNDIIKGLNHFSRNSYSHLCKIHHIIYKLLQPRNL